MSDKKDLYTLLGVAKDASQKEIKNAYRALTQKYHPDKWASQSEEKQEQAKEVYDKIKEAYDILMDDEKRKFYDETGCFSVDDYQLEQKAQVLIFENFTREMKRRNFRVMNYLPDIEDRIQDLIRITNMDIKKVEEERDNYAKVMENFKFGASVVKKCLDDTMAGIEANIARGKELIEVLEYALQVLTRVEYIGPDFLEDATENHMVTNWGKITLNGGDY